MVDKLTCVSDKTDRHCHVTSADEQTTTMFCLATQTIDVDHCVRTPAGLQSVYVTPVCTEDAKSWCPTG